MNTSTSFTGKKKLYFSEKKSIHNDSLNIYDQVELILYLELDPLPSTSPLDLYIVLSPLTIYLHLCLDLNTSTLLPSLTIVGYSFEFLFTRSSSEFLPLCGQDDSLLS